MRAQRVFVSMAVLFTACDGSPAEPDFDAEAARSYRTDVAAEICRLSRECDLALNLPTDDTACRLVVGRLGVGSWPNGDAHRLDADAANQCLALLRTSDCEQAQRDRAQFFEGQIFGGCFAALSGAAEQGEACYAPDDCADGLQCRDFRNDDARDAPCPGVCVVREPGAAEGAPCDTRFCDAGLYCDADRRCRPYPAAGEPCEGTLCAPGLACASYGLCEPPAEEADSCMDIRCAIGLVCGPDERCAPPVFGLAEGEPCGDGRFCGPDTLCLGTCVRRAGLGELCADLVAGMPDIPCEPDLFCRASASQAGVCEPRGLPGEPCVQPAYRSGSFAPPCFGVCNDGVCIDAAETPRLCDRE